MSTIKIIDPITDPRWDTFVESHPFGWICHLSGWKQVLEKSFKHMKGYYIAKLENGTENIQSALPFFQVKSWLTGKRLVSIPFATLCDPLISTNDEMKDLIEFTLELNRNFGNSFIEIRSFQCAHLIQDDRFSKIEQYKNHYLPLQCEIEEIKKSFHRKTVRQSVKRAMKSSLKLKVGDNESDLIEFYKLYIKTRKTIGLPPQPYIFFKMLWNTFFQSGRIALLLAEKDKEIIAGVIIFKFKKRVSAEYAAWDRRYSKLCPNHFLYWNAIKMAHYEKFELFDLGRTSILNKELMKFKKHWGTDIADLPQFYYPESAGNRLRENEKSMSYRFLNTICRNVPDSSLKTIGKLCYRHLG